MDMRNTGVVVAVAKDGEHRFSKKLTPQINLVEGLGVEGDAHSGVTVQHLSRIKADPSQQNLRQVHLMHAELFSEVGKHGFKVGPGDLGENITTENIDLLGLPRGATLKIGALVQLKVTGLRNPCAQIDAFEKGLLRRLVEKRGDGSLVRKAGIMTVVVAGGIVRPGDSIDVEYPPWPHLPLERV